MLNTTTSTTSREIFRELTEVINHIDVFLDGYPRVVGTAIDVDADKEQALLAMLDDAEGICNSLSEMDDETLNAIEAPSDDGKKTIRGYVEYVKGFIDAERTEALKALEFISTYNGR